MIQHLLASDDVSFQILSFLTAQQLAQLLATTRNRLFALRAFAAALTRSASARASAASRSA